MDKKNLKANGSSSSLLSTTNKSKRPSLSSTTASSESSTAAVKNVNISVTLPRSVRRTIQNFVLVWLDENIDVSKKDFQSSLKDLRHIVASITTFTNAQECFSFLSGIKNEKILMIVSDVMGQQIVPDIHAMPQLDSIYVLHGNQSVHDQWTKKTSKVKGVYAKIELIYDALKMDRERCDRAMISISFNGIDTLFMYTQSLRETLLETEDDDKRSIREFVEYCRLEDDIHKDEIQKIEQEYDRHTPIWWYTAPYFIKSMLNYGFRHMDVDVIFKMGFFIRHLHQHIESLHRKQQSSKTATLGKFEVFRGQGLSEEAFENIKKTKGGLMSFNNFLATSRNRNISVKNFARPAAFDLNSVGILFVMTIDPAHCLASSIPFAEVKNVGFSEDQGEEILFSTHTVFRIDRIERIEDKHTFRLWQIDLTLVGNQDKDFDKLGAQTHEEHSLAKGWPRLVKNIGFSEDQGEEILFSTHTVFRIDRIERIEDKHTFRLWQVDLTLVGNQDKDFDKLVAQTHEEHSLAKGWPRLGLLLIKLEAFAKAEKLLHILLQKATYDEDRADYNFYLGWMYYNMREYLIALTFYERALDIRRGMFHSNDRKLAQSYNGIGEVHNRMGEYLKALAFFEQALDILKITLLPNHPDLAYIYNNIGLVHDNMGDYSKALSFLEKALDMHQKSLPPVHPTIVKLKSNIENIKKKL
ncbi:unnamed protein product [Rotaria sp. Silwood1]|nr:unnamed protein product [Rotaria sp. Silwood1]